MWRSAWERSQDDNNEEVKPTTKNGVRSAAVDRVTAETRIAIRLVIEGRGQYKVSTGIRFFDHMLESSHVTEPSISS